MCTPTFVGSLAEAGAFGIFVELRATRSRGILLHADHEHFALVGARGQIEFP
jgi:hypothetical protein